MPFITHKRDDGDYQKLKDHIYGVAQMAEAFGAPFAADKHAKRAGLLHDIGKYSAAAQDRQRDPEHTSPVDHSTAGLQIAMQMKDLHTALAVAGHHGGLPDFGNRVSKDDGTLMARVQKKLTGTMDASLWRTEIGVTAEDALPGWLKEIPPASQGFANALYTRMLFSCLVDADYLDTEAYMERGSVQRGTDASMDLLLRRLEDYVSPWRTHAETALNQKRNAVLERCLSGGKDNQGLYALTIPTGGGKTVSSLAFALSHAARRGLRRVIYVVPYTSIIEQNAQVFRSIVGEENVLEHHANAEYDDDDQRLRLSAENWDSPIVVTTAVQFFESLFSARTSRCRKLHNIASSVVILDEAQMLPVSFLRPCVNAIVELVQHYHVTAVLCTATQPSLDQFIHAYAPELCCREIADDVDDLYSFFKRVHFKRENEMTDETIAGCLCDEEQVLCIVNARKSAQKIYHMLPQGGSFHLSTLMTPEHRSKVLQEIRGRLKAELPCRVISTSLVEAGVDLDFPTVWREEAGLDSILQAAGRCNREGKRLAQESVVHIFSKGAKPLRMFEQNVYALRRVIDRYEDIASPQAIRAYFNLLLSVHVDGSFDKKDIVGLSNELAFQNIDREFKLIDTMTIPVYIPALENKELLAALREGWISRNLLRKLGRYAVNVYPQHFRQLQEAGALECPAGEKYGILIDIRHYDDACGLALEPEACDELLCI